jgi:hydrogenase-4 component E
MAAPSLMNLAGIPAFALLALAAATLVSRDARQTAGLYAWASLPQAAICALIGIADGRPELYVLGAAILVIKGRLAPRLLVQAWPEEERGAYGLTGHVGTPGSLVLAALAAAVAFRVAPFVGAPDVRPALAAALAAALVAVTTPVVRHELSAQATGLLLAEAGVTAASLLLIGEIPTAADAVSLADLVALSIALGVLLARVVRLHGKAHALLLTELRG